MHIYEDSDLDDELWRGLQKSKAVTKQNRYTAAIGLAIAIAAIIYLLFI